jgi:hypothetical protein
MGDSQSLIFAGTEDPGSDATTSGSETAQCYPAPGSSFIRPNAPSHHEAMILLAMITLVTHGLAVPARVAKQVRLGL